MRRLLHTQKIQEAFGPDVSRRPGYRKALIEASIVTNAALAAYALQEEFGTVSPTGLNVVYGVYLLENRRVWTPQVSGMTATGLAAAPRGAAGLMELGDALVRSDRIVSLIQT